MHKVAATALLGYIGDKFFETLILNKLITTISTYNLEELLIRTISAIIIILILVGLSK